MNSAPSHASMPDQTEVIPLLSRRPPVEARGLKRAAAAGLGVVAVLALSVAATSRAPRAVAAEPSEPPAALAAQLIEQSSQLFKRTYTSIDAFKDGAWLAEMLGLLIVEAQVTKMRGDDDGAGATTTCAHRLLLSSMDGFQFHFFQSFVTPEGPRGAVGDFIANWTAARGDLSADDYVWDALALPSATLYAPWITPFVHRLNAHGVPMLRWRYARAPAGTQKRWMYSLLVTVPHAGLTLELTSDEELEGSLHHMFDDVEAVAERFGSDCAAATLQLAPTMLDVDEAGVRYHQQGGTYFGRDGGPDLPDLITVAVSAPTTGDADAPRRFLASTIADTEKMTQLNATNGSCAMSAVQMSTGVSDTALPVWLRTVNDGAARARGALAALERAVREAHEEYVGFGRGWDRWMDVRAIARARVPVARKS